MLIISIFFLIGGFFLDGLSLWWGLQTALGGKYKSGIFLIPLIFYALFIWLSPCVFVEENRVQISMAFFIFHLLAWQVIPSILDKFLARKSNR